MFECHNCRDGKAFFPRKPTAAEDYRRTYLNPTVLSQNTLLKPIAQGLKDSTQPDVSQGENKSKPLDAGLLCRKLSALKQEQDKQERFNRHLADKLTSAQPRVFPAVEEDDQSILDQHVSRVFSPYLSPGTISPKHLQRYHRSHEMSTSMPEFGTQTSTHINMLLQCVILIGENFYFDSSASITTLQVDSGACIIWIILYDIEEISSKVAFYKH